MQSSGVLCCGSRDVEERRRSQRERRELDEMNNATTVQQSMRENKKRNGSERMRERRNESSTKQKLVEMLQDWAEERNATEQNRTHRVNEHTLALTPNSFFLSPFSSL